MKVVVDVKDLESFIAEAWRKNSIKDDFGENAIHGLLADFLDRINVEVEGLE